MTYTNEEEMEREDQRILDAHYKGDKTREARELIRGRSIAIGWTDIEACAKVHPEHAQHASDAIERILGYRPVPSITIPHEVFIRTLIAQHYAGAISDEQYKQGLVTHITHIRNDDVKKTLWVGHRGYTMEELSKHNDLPTDLKGRVMDKITAFFGEHPGLIYTLQVELMLAKALQADPILDVAYFTPLDYRAFTIIAYHKVWLDESEEAADRSPLVKMMA